MAKISLYLQAQMTELAQGDVASHGCDCHDGTPGTCPACHAEEFDALLTFDRTALQTRPFRNN